MRERNGFKFPAKPSIPWLYSFHCSGISKGQNQPCFVDTFLCRALPPVDTMGVHRHYGCTLFCANIANFLLILLIFVLECPVDLMKLLVEYFQLFGEKSVCFSDLCIYLDLLDPSRKSEVCLSCFM